jgi:hypothetical protein
MLTLPLGKSWGPRTYGIRSTLCTLRLICGCCTTRPFHSESGHRAERRRQSTYFHFIRRSSSSESGVFMALLTLPLGKSWGPRTYGIRSTLCTLRLICGCCTRAERRRQSTYFHFIRRSSSSESGVFCLLVLASDSNGRCSLRPMLPTGIAQGLCPDHAPSMMRTF